jgi:hypothetical protein
MDRRTGASQRRDREQQTLDDKVRSVERLLADNS